MRTQLDGKAYLQKLQTVAYLYLGVPLIIFIYLYLESSVDQLKEIVQSEYHLTLFVPTMVSCFLIIYWGRRKHRTMVGQARQKTQLIEKLLLYKKANNYRFFTYGLSSIIICCGFYVTNYQAFAALFGIMIVLFSINNPNSRKIVTDLKLDQLDKKIIINGLEIP